jgi:hypothetical protein
MEARSPSQDLPAVLELAATAPAVTTSSKMSAAELSRRLSPTDHTLPVVLTRITAVILEIMHHMTRPLLWTTTFIDDFFLMRDDKVDDQRVFCIFVFELYLFLLSYFLHSDVYGMGSVAFHL